MGSGLRVFIGLAMLVSVSQVWAAKVVVSIPPLAMMIEPLLDEDDELEVLLSPGASPHGFQLKPSHMLAIENADLVVSVGTGVDGWLQRALGNYKGAQSVMMQQPGLVLLEKRQGGVWEKHDHHSHDHDHLHPAKSPKQQAKMDGHIWLSLQNAKALIQGTSEALQALQPLRAGAIAAREQAIFESLQTRETVWREQLKPFEESSFVVMHDAYQYFEYTFGLNASGTIHVNPELPPSAKRLHELRHVIEERKVRCVFTEPQFPQQRLQPVIEGFDVNVGSLDPLGVDEQLVPFEAFYDRLVQDFVACMD